MKLGDHIRSRGMTVGAWAAENGFSEQSIVKYIAGTRIPRPGPMKRIFVASGGAVTPNDFYELDQAAA